MEEEINWIKKIKAGETQYFGMLYQKHHARLYGLCYRFTGNREDAEEQLQEVFMRVLAKIDQFAGQASFATWVWRLAINHLINFSKKTKLESEVLVETGGRRSKPELTLMLEQAIKALPEGFRNVFILHDRVGLAHDEIADVLGCSASTSRSQLFRARLALRKMLQPALSEVTV